MMLRSVFRLFALFALVLFAGCASTRTAYLPGSPDAYRGKTEARWHGRARGYLLDLPPSTKGGGPYPLVVALHGASSSAAVLRSESGLSELGREEGFAVVYPEGIGILNTWFKHWNAGFCCGKAEAVGLDDAGHVLGIVDDLRGRLPIDGRRIYLTGFSDGAMLCFQLAARNPGRFAAVVPVAGTVGMYDAKEGVVRTTDVPTAPTPLLIVHGTDDRRIRFARKETLGSGGKDFFLSHGDTVSFWLEAWDLENAEDPVLESDALRFASWSGPEHRGSVSSLALRGWGHRWPGRRATGKLEENDPLHGFDGTRLIWWFMHAHALPE